MHIPFPEDQVSVAQPSIEFRVNKTIIYIQFVQTTTVLELLTLSLSYDLDILNHNVIKQIGNLNSPYSFFLFLLNSLLRKTAIKLSDSENKCVAT